MDTLKLEEGLDTLQACRICLACDGELFSIREWGLDQVFVDLMGTTLSPWDGFPQHLCNFCRTLLRKAHALRTRCRQAQELLKQALMHQHFITNSYICTIDRTAHKLTHNLHLCMNTVKESFRNEQNKIVPEEKYDLEKPIEFIKEEIEIDADIMEDVFQNDLDIKSDSMSDFSGLNSDDSDSNKYIETAEAGISKTLTNIEKTKTKARAKKKNKEKQMVIRKDKLTKKNKFSTEDDIKEFEEKYDFEVKCLTEEEMAEDMERRKLDEKYLQGEVKCELCYRSFSTVKAFNNHVKYKHNPDTGPNACHLCHSRYRFAVNRNQHIHDAHRLQFRCRRCDAIVAGESLAIEHAASHEGARFKCRHCEKSFLKKTTCATHMRMDHPAENAAGGTCELCGETFISRTGLNCHKTRAHNKPYNAKLHCRKCRMQFENADAMERHKTNRPGNKCDPLASICGTCGEWCTDADMLAKHKHHTHGTPLFTCHDCNKSFISKLSLSTHMDRVHRGVRPARTSDREGTRNRSIGSKICETCGKTFQCFALLKQHQVRHSGDRPFKCELCPKSYATASELRTHHTRHTGVKPHKCVHCSKCYSTSAALKVHVDAVHIRQKEYRCEQCPKTFLRATALSVHKVVHTGEKRFECTLCGAKFTQGGSLATHKKYVHLKLKPPPRKRNKQTH